MRSKAVLSIDQGTTGIRAVLYGVSGAILESSYREFTQYYPQAGWVEHDPDELWIVTQRVIREALSKARLNPRNVIAIGITNQRETALLWDRRTGKPLHRAIVWQDRRTSEDCDRLVRQGFQKLVREKTGLVIDPYFSASKIAWLMRHIPQIQKKIRLGHVLFGTIDTWVIWNLTGRVVHATDVTNASRTMLFNIQKLHWDHDLLKLFGIPKQVLPEVKRSAETFGWTKGLKVLPDGIPICAVLGDQQAALYGQSCYEPGDIKNTYGTGCFIVLNAGKKFRHAPHGLIETIACDREGSPVYAMEGSIFIAGAAIQWLRDGLRLFDDARKTYQMAKRVPDTGGVTMIPAFAGLGSPYWDSSARGMITGITRGTNRDHIVRAALESLAHQTADVLDSMAKDASQQLKILKTDGGATKNPFLMQFQADILGLPVLVSERPELTAWGVGKLAGRACHFWRNPAAIDRIIRYRRYRPNMATAKRLALRRQWRSEIKRLLFSA